ncbi:MAG: class I SAM-dependent methyltransferase [Rhodospirillales bacterium]
MFGELIGLWLGVRWQAMGRPDPVIVVELGPGRGTLMADALRAAAGVEGFADAARVHLVEVSPALRARQQDSLAGATVHAPQWHPGLAEVPEGPTLAIANEFLDTLPVHQFEVTEAGWRERLVGLDGAGGFAFRLASEPPPAEIDPGRVTGAKPGAIAEVRPAAQDLVRALAERFQRHPGAALIVDYGHDRTAAGDTLQAVRSHIFQDPLSDPGRADLSAHVDFAALARAARDAGAEVHGPVDQGTFLGRLGIQVRADSLKKASPGRAEEIDAALARLTSSDGMGRLFKALSLASPGLPAPDGFG